MRSSAASPTDRLAVNTLTIWWDGEADGPTNMAADECLAAEAERRGSLVLRFYGWSETTISLGGFQKIDEARQLEAIRGVPLVRRPSGGGTVVVAPGCLMWTVVEPHPDGAPPIEAIHAGMLGPLASAVSAALAAAGGPSRRVERRGTSDLVLTAGGTGPAADRKVSGNALRVRRHGVLYHGTLLDACDLDLVGRVLRHPPREPDYRAGRPHAEFLANLGLGREALDRAVRAAFHATAAAADWPRDRVARLVRDRYASVEWTARL
jgi:lipoate-protein ligase A